MKAVGASCDVNTCFHSGQPVSAKACRWPLAQRMRWRSAMRRVSDAEYHVREALRSGDDARVVEIFRDAVAHKPQEHEVIEGTERFMSQIGG